MELLTRLPKFDALDLEVAKNFDMASDAIFSHINKRIEVVNLLGDDLFSWTREKLKKRRSWTVNMNARVDGYPIVRKRTITKFAEEDERDFRIFLWIEKGTNSHIGFRIEVNGFFTWYVGQWGGYGKNEADVLFQFRDYERIKTSVEKLGEKFKVEIDYPGSDYENPIAEEDKAIYLATDSTDILNKETILHYHDIFKGKVLEPLFQL